MKFESLSVNEVSDWNTNMKCLLCIFALVATVMADAGLEAVFKKSNDQFSANMLQEVAKSHGDQSCVLSAFSVMSPLAQLALASVGESHDEILRTIGFPNDNITKQVFSDINRSLRSVKGIDLELANKIYVREGFTLNDQFAAMSKQIFNSEVENIEFQHSTTAAAEINAWVEDHTHKHITNLIDPSSINGSTPAILVNAIYFKGNWRIPFNKYLTANRAFHVTKDLTSPIPMMCQTDHFKYTQSDALDAKFLEMKYEGGNASFVVALPNEIDGVNSLIEKMKDPSSLNEVLKQMSEVKVQVMLPKFKIETTTNLVDVLEKMNIKKIFEEANANLSNLLKVRLIDLLMNQKNYFYVSDATQKASIEVNEAGAEAEAANTILFSYKSIRPLMELVLDFKADHPFLFFVMENNNILFSGVYRS